MNEKSWESYIQEVLSFVRFKYDHKSIRMELQEHMEDLYEELKEDGMDEPLAKLMTVEYMGDASEIGQELNKEHHVLLGILWYIARLLVPVTVLVTAFTYVLLGHSILMPLLHDYSGYEEYMDSPIVFSVEGEYESYDDTLILDGLKLHENGTLDIRYQVRRNPFARSILVHNYVEAIVLDETGENLHIGPNGNNFRANMITGCKGQCVRFVPEEAQTLVLYWAELELHIDLDSGEVSMH